MSIWNSWRDTHPYKVQLEKLKSNSIQMRPIRIEGVVRMGKVPIT